MINTRVDIGFQAVEFAPLASVDFSSRNLAPLPGSCLVNWPGKPPRSNMKNATAVKDPWSDKYNTRFHD